MGIWQPRFIVFFIWMLIIPPAVGYFGKFDTTLDFLFFARAFAIAFCSTIIYYIILKKTGKA